MTDAETKLVSAAQTVAGSESGKILLDYLSGFCFEKRSTFVRGGKDSFDDVNVVHYEHINQGKRAVILRIRELIETDLNKPKPEPVKEQNYITSEE